MAAIDSRIIFPRKLPSDRLSSFPSVTTLEYLSMTLERREQGRVSIQFSGEKLSTPGESWNSRGRAIKGGHNCFQVVETLGPRKILSETVFQLLLSPPSLLTSRLGEISRNGEENVSNGYVSGSL